MLGLHWSYVLGFRVQGYILGKYGGYGGCIGIMGNERETANIIKVIIVACFPFAGPPWL